MLKELVRSDVRWLPIAGYEGRYEVSDDGRVYSLLTGRFLKLNTNGYGYLQVNLSSGGGKIRSIRVHRLVAEAFIGPRPAGLFTCHNNGDKRNNALSNLRYDTQSANELDKERHGTAPNALKTECIRGHSFDEANTRWRPEG